MVKKMTPKQTPKEELDIKGRDKDSFDIYDLTEATPGLIPDFQLFLDSE